MQTFRIRSGIGGVQVQKDEVRTDYETD